MRISALVMATILAVVCLAACGGDGDEEGPPAATVTPAPAAAETPAAGAETPAARTETPTVGAETPTAGAETPAATPTPAGAALAPGDLTTLNSYRYTMKMELEGLESDLTEQMAALPGQDPMAESLKMEISGAFVAPDKAESRISISGVDDEIALVVIGDQQWVEMGDMAIGPIQATGDVSELDFALMMWEGFSEGAGGLTCTSEKKEKVNDVPTNYCGIDQATFEQLSSLFGGTEEMGDIEEMNLEMWLAEDGGWPVRLRVQVAGTDETGQEFDAKLEMDITDVNEDIEINPPS
jgi:predicted small lipoprotein YifL